MNNGLVNLNTGPNPSDGAIRSIKATFSVILSALKKVCDELVPSLYSFAPSASSDDNEAVHIADRVKDLLLNGKYTKDPVLGGDYTHPALRQITKKFCYNPRNGVARGHDKEFGPLFPLNYIALVFAAIKCILESYQSGEHKVVEFSRANYFERYEANLADLQKITNSNNNDKKKLLEKVRQDLFTLRLKKEGGTLNAESYLSDNDY